MNFNDFAIVSTWWLLLSLVGVVAFPLSLWIFSRFWDKGWAFSKALGLGILTYFVWVVGSLKLAKFATSTIWIGIGLIVAADYLLWPKVKKSVLDFIRERNRIVVVEEIMFFVALIFWSWVRSFQPDINGLEKFMDFGFVNSILRSDYFPPSDIWLSGLTINYYYFGHLVTGLLTKLTSLPASYTYNLMIATLFALALVLTFSLGGTLVSQLFKEKWVSERTSRFLVFLGALVSALVLTLGGNLHTVVTVLSKGAGSYWYPDATRYIPNTIHEFPHYSFVVADLHGHVNNIPFVLLMIAFILSFVLEYGSSSKALKFSIPVVVRLLSMSLLIGVLYMTNALDGPIYLLLLGVSFLAIALHQGFSRKNVSFFAAALVVVAFGAFLFSLPFHLNFTPFTKGVALVNARSSIWQLLVLWGFFLFVGLALILVFLTKGLVKRRRTIIDPMLGWFLLGVVGVSFLLVVIPEIIYIKDIYIPEYHRANTMFKLVYQTFMLMSLVSGPGLVLLIFAFFDEKRGWRRLVFGFFNLVFLVGLVSILLYPYFAVRSYYNRLKNPRGLDGLSWMEQQFPDDYAGVVWLNENIEGQPVIAEAVGESYTNFARVSANTGLPTILGWRVHEWLWRGSFDEPAFRTGEVETLFISKNPFETCRLIEKYALEYVFIGSLEKDAYSQLYEDKFNKLGYPVFSKGGTSIYLVRRPCDPTAYDYSAVE